MATLLARPRGCTTLRGEPYIRSYRPLRRPLVVLWSVPRIRAEWATGECNVGPNSEGEPGDYGMVCLDANGDRFGGVTLGEASGDGLDGYVADASAGGDPTARAYLLAVAVCVARDSNDDVGRGRYSETCERKRTDGFNTSL